MAHGDPREGKWRGGNRRMGWGKQYSSHYHGTWCIPASLPLMRTPRLPAVDWTDAPPPADLNGLVRFAERRNLVYGGRVPSHLNWAVPGGSRSLSCSRRVAVLRYCHSRRCKAGRTPPTRLPWRGFRNQNRANFIFTSKNVQRVAEKVLFQATSLYRRDVRYSQRSCQGQSLMRRFAMCAGQEPPTFRRVAAP